ncbi:MAG: hypothetical protein CMJ53_01625 [Planctomycetaceae bacterium]|nr:hypothetical protein [Planctomycetaceae bacterium]
MLHHLVLALIHPALEFLFHRGTVIISVIVRKRPRGDHELIIRFLFSRLFRCTATYKCDQTG